MPIDRQRLIQDLRELASIGRFETGVDRTAFSADDMHARRWLAGRMQAAGLEAVLDDVGNVVGRMQGVRHAVLIGSHTDTVPKGGWLDGSLGVIYGLEIARCVAEMGLAARVGIGVDVVSFQDEEGTFLALLGSRAFCGEDVAGEVAQARDRNGKPLSEAMREAGVVANAAARLDRARHIAFLEAHIEQGPRLEASGNGIGVVSAIVGIRSFRISFAGRADHAGTTPMGLRSDAGAAAIAFGATLAERFRAVAGSDTVWNIGGCTFRPGANNVVPAEAELAFQFRDTSPAAMDRLEAIVHEIAASAAATAKAKVVVTRVLSTPPTPMDAGLQAVISASATALGASQQSLPSGAGHDALVLARCVPTAMLFVPSIGGRSHHVSEDTAEADIVLGAEVLLEAVRRQLIAAG